MIWLGILACLVVSFVFSGIEAGILSVNRVRLKHRVKMKDRAAIKLNRLLSHPERVLITVLVVTHLMNITAIIFISQEMVRYFDAWGYAITFAAFLPIYLFVLELLPKSLFRRFPYRALAYLTEPLRLADLLLSPMHWVGSRVSAWVLRKKSAEQKKLFVAREDFKYLTIESERTGAISSEERAMIHNVIDFRAVTAGQVMIPIQSVQTIPASASVPELVEKSDATGFDRWPVVAADGRITGIVNLLDIALDQRRNGPVELYQRRIVRVSPETPAFAILRRLRAARLTMAVVNDPAGQPVGIVSSEDLVKRLVAVSPLQSRTLSPQ